MRMIEFEIPGQPVAKARARTVRTKGGKVRTYTPVKTKNWEQFAQISAWAEYSGAPIAGPIMLTVIAVFGLPVSWPKWKKDAAQDGRIIHASKPDADNVLKAVKDALNGIIWIDDAQVSRAVITKKYGAAAKVKIIVREISAAGSNVKSKAEFERVTGC